MNTNNINQLFKNVIKNLSLVSISLGFFNTYSNLTTINNLRNKLENEKDINNQLSIKINNLISENESNSKLDKLEPVLRKSLEIQENHTNKLEIINNKINNINENKLIDENSLITINESMKNINNELLELFNKMDDCIKNNLINWNIFNDLQNYINNLNVFQSFAITHLCTINLIFIFLIDLLAIYFSDYLINKFNVKDKYPKIYKFLEIRRKFKTFFLIKDIIIIIIALIALTILNIMLFYTFSL